MSPRAHTALHGFLLVHAAIWLLWLAYAFLVADAPPQRDWFVLREVGVAFVHGDFASLYIDRFVPEGRMFFQYPPFVLYPLALLAIVPPMVAYAMVCATQLAAAGAMLVLLFRLARTPDADLAIAGVFGSAAMSSVIVSGQSSALLGTRRHRRRRRRRREALVRRRGAHRVAPRQAELAARARGVRRVEGRPACARGTRRTIVVLLAEHVPLASLWQEFFRVAPHVESFKPAYPAFKEITLPRVPEEPRDPARNCDGDLGRDVRRARVAPPRRVAERTTVRPPARGDDALRDLARTCTSASTTASCSPVPA
jgi:hypothetical protein